MKSQKIAVLACLSSFISTYSVSTAVLDHLRMLSKYSKKSIVFITTDDFTDQHLVPKGIEIRYYPRYKHSLDSDTIKIIEFEKYVFEVSSILRTHLSDCSHVIQHDLLFIDGFVPLNWSIRECGKLLPKLKWLHWQHSGPSNMSEGTEYPFTGCYMGMENSKFIYLNRVDIPQVAERYSIPENQISVVHNCFDFSNRFDFHPLTNELVDHLDLLNADTICIYPTRLSEPKQIEKIVKLLEKLKIHGSVRLIICNSWSNAQKEIDYLNKIKNSTTLTNLELTFTSQFESQWCKDTKHEIDLGVPQKVIDDLMRISDLFILPSQAECCSLIMLEAAANKNLMILNDDLWSLHEFGGQKMNGNKSYRAMYLEFGSSTRPIANYLPSEDAWYTDKANQIRDYQLNNQAIGFFKFVRKRHNPKWIYINEIEPLLS